MRLQNPSFALLGRFMGILRLFEDRNLIVEHDDGEHCNLFDFREPETVTPGQRCPSISGELTSDRCISLDQQRKVGMRPCCSPLGSDWAGIRAAQASTSLQDISIQYMAANQMNLSRTVMVYCVDHGYQRCPFRNWESFP